MSKKQMTKSPVNTSRVMPNLPDLPGMISSPSYDGNSYQKQIGMADEDTGLQSGTSSISQEKTSSFPKVKNNSRTVEKPKASSKTAKSKDNGQKPSSKGASKKVKEDRFKEKAQSKRIEEVAVAATPTEPVGTQKNKVKENNKLTQENKDKKKGDSVKSKVDTEKKDKHKPFRRGHDLDMDSKVKSEFFSMRLSGKELDSLSKKAAKCHMSTSTYARETLLSSVPREALSEKDRNAMDKAYTMLEDANFNVRQMANHFHSMLSEKDKDGKVKYDRQTWNELKIVIQKQKAVLDFLDSEFRIYK